MNRKPRLGHFVNYVRKHPLHGTLEIRPLLILRGIDSDVEPQMVNGVVFIDGANDVKGNVIPRDPAGNEMYPVTEWATSIRFAEPVEGEPLTEGTWHWPSEE